MTHVNGFSCSLALIVALAACGDTATDVVWQKLDGLDYAIPTGWTVRDQSERDRKILVWTPNENASTNESVTVMRTKPLVALSKVDLPQIGPLLEAAHEGLPNGRFSKPERFTTPKGFVGLRMEGHFTPSGTAMEYRRVHAVFLDGTSLIHVLYTAPHGASDTEAFHVVLDSLMRREA